MATIDNLKNKEDEIILPRTVTEAIFDAGFGMMLDQILVNLDDNSIDSYNTSGTGYWIKFKNGLIIQGMSSARDINVDEEWGALYTSSLITLDDWPIEMVETPYHVMSVRSSTSYIIHSVNDVSRISGGSTYLTRPARRNVTDRVYFHQLAFGRWK